MSETRYTELELHKAIHKLVEFSRKHDISSQKPLQKTIHLMRTFLQSDDQKHSDSHEVLKAIDIVNRERFRIQKMKAGNPAEQKLADSYTKAIEHFNCSIDLYKEDGKTANPLVKAFFSKVESIYKELPKIDLPQATTIKKHFSSPSSHLETNQKIASLQQNLICKIQLSKQSIELFQMKVIALLERYGIASHSEARQIVKKSPIETSLEAETSCTLSQTISLFPGQTVLIKGSSELDPKTHSISQLFPESFSVSLESTQTGYPHPSQRAGWTFSHQLIPDCLHRPELLPDILTFFQRKKNVIQGLHQSSELLSRAKRLLYLKRQIFDQNRLEFLQLHKQLALALYQAGSPSQKLDEGFQIIESYYQFLDRQAAGYDRISETYQLLNQHFIAHPHSCLVQACGEESKPNDVKAQKILDEALSHQERLALGKDPSEDQYLFILGKLIGKASQKLILQYFSEGLVYSPPSLSSFEKIIQNMAFAHGQDFFEELNHDVGDLSSVKSRLITLLKRDIACFQGSEQSSISEELDFYFKKRYQDQLG